MAYRGKSPDPLGADPAAGPSCLPAGPRLRERGDGRGAIDGQRDELGAAWLADARNANTAAARFERLRLHLLRHGAPLQLVRAAGRAREEESQIRELCLDVADRCARERGDRKLPSRAPCAVPDASQRARCAVPDASQRARCAVGGERDDDSFEVALAVLHGCVGATLQAAVARVAAQDCRDAYARRALRRISVRATRHAGLSWRVLRWALERDPHGILRGALARSLAEVLAGATAREPSAGRQWFHSPGHITPAEQARVTACTLEQVVLPCARAVLGAGAAYPGKGSAELPRFRCLDAGAGRTP